MTRYPQGRKGYNGRVERSHRSDDEEFYRPLLLAIQDCDQFLAYGQRWEYFYNALRPHFGHDMGERTSLEMLYELGYTGDAAIALFSPFLLDKISTHLVLSCYPGGGNDLLAHYRISARVYILFDYSEKVRAFQFTYSRLYLGATAIPTSPRGAANVRCVGGPP